MVEATLEILQKNENYKRQGCCDYPFPEEKACRKYLKLKNEEQPLFEVSNATASDSSNTVELWCSTLLPGMSSLKGGDIETPDNFLLVFPTSFGNDLHLHTISKYDIFN